MSGENSNGDDRVGLEHSFLFLFYYDAGLLEVCNLQTSELPCDSEKTGGFSKILPSLSSSTEEMKVCLAGQTT